MEYDFDTSLLEKQAQEEARKGELNYSRWWHSSAVSRAEKLYLVKGGFHDTFKSIAKDVDKKGS